jgi:polyphosphate kinase 2
MAKAKNRESDAISTGGKTAFVIERKDLPPAIEAAAMRSGGYPYDKKMKRKQYEEELEKLQIELLKLQSWARDKGERIVIVFEGRDGAGKGGTIHRFTQHLTPRGARVVALTKPSDEEQGQWYFQRYMAELPTRGEMTLFDRSWYNRAGVERVMRFATKEQVRQFLKETPAVEKMLARDGIRLVKLFLSIGHEMQMKRLHARYHDPLKRWKLSPIDVKARSLYAEYTTAREAMFAATHTPHAPWTMVDFNDQKRGRLTLIRDLLDRLPDCALLEEPIEWPELGHAPLPEHYGLLQPLPPFRKDDGEDG